MVGFPKQDGTMGTPPSFQSRLRVQAIPIMSAKPAGHGSMLLTLGDGFAALEAPLSLSAGHMPATGDMLVLMADGSQIVRDKITFAAHYEAVAEPGGPTGPTGATGGSTGATGQTGTTGATGS
jgi:hypothetical protein